MNILLALGLIVQATYAGTATSTAATTSPLGIRQTIDDSAQRYGVSARILDDVLSCESSMRPEAIGDGGTSFGIAQIHLPSHPEITESEAFDYSFSIDYLAREISIGNGGMWTCYRNMELSPQLLATRP